MCVCTCIVRIINYRTRFLADIVSIHRSSNEAAASFLLFSVVIFFVLLFVPLQIAVYTHYHLFLCYTVYVYPCLFCQFSFKHMA